MNLPEMLKHFFALYGHRNAVYLGSLQNKVGFLSLAVVDLHRAVRKDVGKEKIALALARIVSRIFCVMEHFGDHSLLPEAMSRKYPAKCAYCGENPCVCDNRRRDHQLAEAGIQSSMIWGLSDWSEHLFELYGKNNSAKNINDLISHIAEEVVETMALCMKIPNLDMSPQDIEFEIALELADTLAWTLAVANVYDISIQETIIMRYYPDCWKCHENPCVCSKFSFKQVDWLALKI